MKDESRSKQCNRDASILRDGGAISAVDPISFDALYESAQKCKAGVLWKSQVARFISNGLDEVYKLYRELADGTYKPRKPVTFFVTSPKRREVLSIGFRDRVYQRSLNDNVVYPACARGFIHDNWACQKGKGTDKARDRLVCFLQRMFRKHGKDFHVLQCDIRGYYPNMRHDVALAMFRKRLDPITYKRVEEVLKGQYAGDVGFDPGSQMVQIAGISVLDNLDHFIKERLRIKCYLRYMDDFILLGESIKELELCRLEIEKQLEKIGFLLNSKKTRIYRVTEGIKFLGFIFRLNNRGGVSRILDPKNVRQERKKLVRLAHLYHRGTTAKAKCDECFTSWIAHAGSGDSWQVINRMKAFYKTLMETKI